MRHCGAVDEENLMKKLVALMLGLALASSAYAGSSSKDGGEQAQENATGIITPGVATGLVMHYRLESITGQPVRICPSEHLYSVLNSTCGGRENNAWVSPDQTIPKGKTYVGFRTRYNQGQLWSIEVFYK